MQWSRSPLQSLGPSIKISSSTASCFDSHESEAEEYRQRQSSQSRRALRGTQSWCTFWSVLTIHRLRVYETNGIEPINVITWLIDYCYGLRPRLLQLHVCETVTQPLLESFRERHNLLFVSLATFWYPCPKSSEFAVPALDRVSACNPGLGLRAPPN